MPASVPIAVGRGTVSATQSPSTAPMTSPAIPSVDGPSLGSWLLIRFSSLGDVVLVTAAVDAILDVWPATQLTLLTRARYATLFAADPRFARVLGVDDRALCTARGLWDLRRSLRREGFDAVLDLHATPRSRALTAGWPRVPCRRIRKHAVARRLSARLLRRRVEFPPVVARYLAPLAGVDAPQNLRGPGLVVDPAARAHVRVWLTARGHREGERLVGINPSAHWPAKRWTSEGWRSVVETFSARDGMRALILGTHEDLGLARALAEGLGDRCIVAAGQFGLTGLVAAIGELDLLISPDSAPVHIACGVGVPVVALFGPTHPSLGFGPLGVPSRALTEDLPCSPCSLHGELPCRYGHRACMTAMGPEAVITAAEALLEER